MYVMERSKSDKNHHEHKLHLYKIHKCFVSNYYFNMCTKDNYLK